jgi:hypothetical protein
MIGKAQSSRLVVPSLLIAFIGACTPQNAPPPDPSYVGGPLGTGSDGGRSPRADAGGGGSAGLDATATDAAGTDAGLASDTSPSQTTPFQGFDVAVSPDYPTDASYTPVRPDTGIRGGGDSTVCYQQMAWWMTGAALDTSVVSSSAAAQLNPLLSAQHPLTLADYVDSAGQYWLQVSGTETNGVQQQYFPYQYAVAPAALSIAPGQYPVLTATPPSSQPSGGFIRLLDSSQTEVWIEITQISVSATAGDPLCQTLTSGTLTAIVPKAAGSTALVVGGGSTTVGQVFGPTTATAPAGWNIAVTFAASKTQGSFK